MLNAADQVERGMFPRIKRSILNISENTKPHFLGPRNEITHKKERIRDFFTVGTSRCKMVDEVIRCTYNEFRKCNFFLKNNFYYMKKS